MLIKAVLVFMCMMFSVGVLAAGENDGTKKIKDYGRQPWVVDIEDLTTKNDNFRATHWTGNHLQMTAMTIKPGGEIGLEKHDEGDQFIRVEQGEARIVMGQSKELMTFNKKVSDDWAIFIPSGFWHNIINEGNKPLKVYVIYAPPEHPAGTLHKTFEDAEAAHAH